MTGEPILINTLTKAFLD